MHVNQITLYFSCITLPI